MPDLSAHDFRRILLIKPSSLGDVIHALPVLSGLRRRFPRATIRWLLNTEYVNLLRDHPQLDDIIPFDRRQFRSLSGSIRMTFRLGGFARELRQRQFDLAIDLQGLFRSGLMAFASGAAVRLGFCPSREGSGMFYNMRIPVPDREMHAVDKNYLVAGVLGFGDLAITFQLPVSDAARCSARRKLQAAGLDERRDYVLVTPGSRWETKNWRPEGFSATIDHLHKNLDTAVVLSGAAQECDLCQLISQSCCLPPINVAGQMNLAELVALIEGAALIITNDSAPLHIARALNRPLVSIFGPSSPRRTGPYGAARGVLQSAVACSPCFYRRLSQCPIQHQCMKDVTVDHVTRAAAAALHTARNPALPQPAASR